MKLKKAIIKNFRSISDIEVEFSPSCRILIGINESGKSNILKALSLLGDYFEPKNYDVREPLPSEAPVTESHVKFIFSLENNEYEELYSEICKYFLTPNITSKLFLSEDKKIALKELIYLYTGGLYDVDIIKNKKQLRYYSVKNCSSKTRWVRLKSEYSNVTIDINGEICSLNKYKFIDNNVVRGIVDESFLQNIDFQEILDFIGERVFNIIKESLPTVIFWEYSKENLLPPSINISQFSADPNMCKPLKNMFILAGHIDIKNSITKVLEGNNHNKLNNFLTQIATCTTNYFRKVWKDNDKLEFSLRADSGFIRTGIREKNIIDLDYRSDGFKRFVAFLLMISANVATENIKGNLLLVDEPEASLHPSGAKYLMKELIEISKKNYVTYSTHSIFMIDSDDISKHYICTKKNEITSINDVKESNVKEEEVIFNALGYSVYNLLKSKNIILEGYTDKRLFSVASKSLNLSYQKKLKNIGVMFAKGLPHIKAITPILESVDKEYVVLSDSDNEAKNFQKRYDGKGKWLLYSNICDDSKNIITAEDFVKNNHLINILIDVGCKHAVTLDRRNISLDTFDKLKSIKKCLREILKNDMHEKNIVDEFKQEVFLKLEISHIENAYFKMLKNLIDKISN